MYTYKLRAHSDADGTVTLHVPIGTPDHEVEVVVVVASLPDQIDPTDERGWPIGYFEETYGSMADDPMERGNQGESEVRDELL